MLQKSIPSSGKERFFITGGAVDLAPILPFSPSNSNHPLSSMSTEPRLDLSIMLQPPPGESASQPHERRIDNIPCSIAEEIVRDFVSQGPGSDTDRYQMYSVGTGGDERLIALDFGEVDGLLLG
jgi:hypothetical protein